MGILLKIISVLGILSLPLTVLAYRMGIFNFGVAFNILQVLGILFAAVVLLSIIVMLFSRKKNPRSATSARFALILSLVPLVALGAQAYKGKTLPEIHNISTDVNDPPQFRSIVQLRAANHNPLEYVAAELAEVQQEAYPMIKSLRSTLAPPAAYRKALNVVAAIGWDVVAEYPTSGEIEASKTSLIWGFTDDIVIRVKAIPQGSVIDLRSVSRIGRSDLGANAARIEKFLRKFDDD